jgi:tetratricopeptide (TPR) repeat protein
LSKLDETRARAILKQADLLTQIQQWDRAEAVIQTIASFEMRIEGLCTLGRKLTQSRRWKRAKAYWERAETVILTNTSSYMRIVALCKLVRTLAQDRQWEQAENLLKKAGTEVNNVKDNYLRAQAFHELRDAQAVKLSAQGRALLQAGQWKRANKVINLIEDDNQRTEVLRELGIVLAQAGQWERAKEMINSIQDDDVLVEVLCEMGRTLAKAEQSEQTEIFWKEVEAMISSMTHSFVRIEVLHVLGNILGQAGQWERAAFFFLEAEKIGVTENDDMQEDFFQETGEIIDLIEDDDEQIREVIDGMVDENEINRDIHNAVLRALGMALAHTEQWEQAEGVINKIVDPVAHIGALRELAAVLASEDKIKEYLGLVQRYWLQAANRESALQLLPLAYGLIFLRPEIGTDFSEAFAWVDSFLKG